MTQHQRHVADRVTIDIVNTLQERRARFSDVINHVGQDIVNAAYAAGATIKPIFVWFSVDMLSAVDVAKLRKQCLHTMNFSDVLLPNLMVFTCYLNYLNTFDSYLRDILREPLSRDYSIVEGTYDRAMDTYHVLGFDYENLEDYDGFLINHNLFAYGILGNIIGKYLDTNNYQPWKERRKFTYSVAAGVDPTDEFLDFCYQCQSSCLAIFKATTRRIEITRNVFKSIRSASTSKDKIASPVCSATMTMLSGVGISNFIFIDKWIICLNPILLGWQELAKYVPYIIAAYKKYNELGENAPYCKLLFSQDQLTEFHRDKLKVPFTVARAIAQQYGSSSIVNLQGDSKEQEIQNIVKVALNK